MFWISVFVLNCSKFDLFSFLDRRWCSLCVGFYIAANNSRHLASFLWCRVYIFSTQGLLVIGILVGYLIARFWRFPSSESSTSHEFSLSESPSWKIYIFTILMAECQSALYVQVDRYQNSLGPPGRQQHRIHIDRYIIVNHINIHICVLYLQVFLWSHPTW